MDPGSIWYSNTCCWQKEWKVPHPSSQRVLGTCCNSVWFPIHWQFMLHEVHDFVHLAWRQLATSDAFSPCRWRWQMPHFHAGHVALDHSVCHSPFWLRLKAKQSLFFLKLLSSWWLGSGFRCLKVRNSIQKMICRIPCAIYWSKLNHSVGLGITECWNTFCQSNRWINCSIDCWNRMVQQLNQSWELLNPRVSLV